MDGTSPGLRPHIVAIPPLFLSIFLLQQLPDTYYVLQCFVSCGCENPRNPVVGNVVSFRKHRAVVLVWLLTNTQV